MEQLGILYYVGSLPRVSESTTLSEINELYNRGAVFVQNDPEENISHKEYKELNIPVYFAGPSYTNISQLIFKKSAQMALSHVATGFQAFLTEMCRSQVRHKLDTNVEPERQQSNSEVCIRS